MAPGAPSLARSACAAFSAEASSGNLSTVMLLYTGWSTPVKLTAMNPWQPLSSSGSTARSCRASAQSWPWRTPRRLPR